MLWCPTCRHSAPPGSCRCPECGGALSELPRAEWSFAQSDRPGRRILQDPVHLANLPDYASAGMLAEILEDNGILSFMQESGTLGQASNTYLGTSLLGYDLYVERPQLTEAREWMEAFLHAPAQEEDEPTPSPTD